LKYFKEAIEKDPTYALAYVYIAMDYAVKGMYNEAIENTQKGMDLLEAPTSQRIVWLGIWYARSGKRVEAEKVINKLLNISKQMYVSPLAIAALYGELSQMDKLHLALSFSITLFAINLN